MYCRPPTRNPTRLPTCTGGRVRSSGEEEPRSTAFAKRAAARSMYTGRERIPRPQSFLHYTNRWRCFSRCKVSPIQLLARFLRFECRLVQLLAVSGGRLVPWTLDTVPRVEVSRDPPPGMGSNMRQCTVTGAHPGQVRRGVGAQLCFMGSCVRSHDFSMDIHYTVGATQNTLE